MSYAAAIRLVKSLSKIEKRQFSLGTRKHQGEKDYMDLFQIIDAHPAHELDTIRDAFQHSHPKASLENTARYLVKILSDVLIQSKLKDDTAFKLQYGLLRIQLLNERSLPEEGYKELKRLQPLAIQSQNYPIQYMLYRQELNYVSDHNFKDLSEKTVIDTQLKARNVLKDMRNIQEHYSLYELLKFRLVRSGKVLSEEGRKQLNDLVLSEMGLVTGRIRHNFESQKLHLLFQSVFFTDIGDYKSAKKTFHVLNRHFEQHTSLWSYPPLDYFSSLNGILDSLRAIGQTEEIPFYLTKLIQLDNPSYPEYFCYLVRKTILIYQLFASIREGNPKEAIERINKTKSGFFDAYSSVHGEQQDELLFYAGLSFFIIENYRKAFHYIRQVITKRRADHTSILFKAARLLGILIHYEDGNLEYLDYEIRSYKRTYTGNVKLLKTEKLIFKTISLHPDLNGEQKNRLLWKKITPLIGVIEKDKYENQLHKYFNFTQWVKEKFNKP